VVIRRTSSATVCFLAAVAGVVSYGHMHALALRYGEEPWTAALLPLSVDGMIIAASLFSGAPSVSHDVAPEASRRAFATRLRGCGARCRCCSDACCRRTGRCVQHLWCDYLALMSR
jgi:hypothetical protein